MKNVLGDIEAFLYLDVISHMTYRRISITPKLVELASRVYLNQHLTLVISLGTTAFMHPGPGGLASVRIECLPVHFARFLVRFFK